jgi:hypothetical protein
MAKIIIFINNIAIIWQIIGKNNLNFAIDRDKIIERIFPPITIYWDKNNKSNFLQLRLIGIKLINNIFLFFLQQM